MKKNEAKSGAEIVHGNDQNTKTYASVAAAPPSTIDPSTALPSKAPDQENLSNNTVNPSAPSNNLPVPSANSVTPKNPSTLSPKVNFVDEEFIPLKHTSMLTKKDETVESALLKNPNLEEVSAEKINKDYWKKVLIIVGSVFTASTLTYLLYRQLKQRRNGY